MSLQFVNPILVSLKGFNVKVCGLIVSSSIPNHVAGYLRDKSQTKHDFAKQSLVKQPTNKNNPFGTHPFHAKNGSKNAFEDT